MIYSISYDLRKPGRDYTDLYEAIKKLSGVWCRPVESTWYVNCQLNASAIVDRLKSVMDSSDGIIVTAAGAPGAWDGLPTNVSEWLKAHLK